MAATRAYLIPVQEMTPGQATSIRERAIDEGLAEASAKLKMPVGELVARDILPDEDLDYATHGWHELTGTTRDIYETMCQGSETGGVIKNNRFLVIFGVNDLSESMSVSALKFNFGGADRAIWNLENLYSANGGPRVGITPFAVMIPQNIPLTVSRYVEHTAVPAHIVLRGVTIEPRGKVISP